MKWLPVLILMGVGFSPSLSTAQMQNQKPTKAVEAPTVASIMEAQLKMLESQFVPAAEAMPEDRYSFAPEGGDFKEVRTFAMEVKHVATANMGMYSAILGQDPPAGVSLTGLTNGPENIKTKAQILQFLRDSFALGHRAIAALTAQNAVTPLAKSPIPSMKTRLELTTFSLVHASDHYGQMIEYLRMNGITPPASKGQPPANPSGS